VQIVEESPVEYRPRAIGWICGIYEIDSPEKAEKRGWALGVVLYLIEYADGASMEIPGDCLRLLKDED
jgi:hypothetical protein